MIYSPKTTLTAKYLYIRNGVIFDIKSVGDTADTCCYKLHKSAEEMNADTEYSRKILAPSFTVVKDSVTTVYFLDRYIKDGDAYDTTNGFKVTVHGATESQVAIATYFDSMISQEISSMAEDSDNYLAYIPSYLLPSDTSTVSGVTKLTTSAIENAVKAAAVEAGKKAAKEVLARCAAIKDNEVTVTIA